MKKVFIVSNGLGEDDENENTTPVQKVPSVEKPEDQKVLVSMSDLEKLIDERLKSIKPNDNKEILEAIKLIAKNQSSNGQYDLLPVDINEIDPDDYLQVPAVFFAFCVKTRIYDDVRYKRAVKPPYGEIVFTTAVRTVAATNHRIPQYTSICTAFIYSKKQAEFVRQHSLFGIMYFEKIGGEMVSADDADALTKASAMLSRLSEHELRARAMNSGMKINTTDPDVLRKQLTKFIADDLKKKDEEARKARLIDLESKFGTKPDQESQVKTAQILA